MVNNKDKPLWKRLLAKGTALAAAVGMLVLPATAPSVIPASTRTRPLRPTSRPPHGVVKSVTAPPTR